VEETPRLPNLSQRRGDAMPQVRLGMCCQSICRRDGAQSVSRPYPWFLSPTNSSANFDQRMIPRRELGINRPKRPGPGVRGSAQQGQTSVPGCGFGPYEKVPTDSRGQCCL
jgi:hypothetical protein